MLLKWILTDYDDIKLVMVALSRRVRAASHSHEYHGDFKEAQTR